MDETAGNGGSTEDLVSKLFLPVENLEEIEEDHLVVVRRRMKKNKFMKQVDLAHVTNKVKILYGFLWFSEFIFVFPFLSWMWTAITFFEYPSTFAVNIMKYACSVVCVFELLFLIALMILGILRLVTIKRKKSIRRIRSTADITTGIFVAHLLVYIPMSAFVVTRFKSRIYDEMKLTVQTKKDFEKKDDVWITTQTFYNCCGLEGPKDWAWDVVNRTAILSCCKDAVNCRTETAFTSGCYEPQRAMLDLYFLMVGLPTLAFQLILTVLTFYGFNSYRVNSKKMRMLEASEKAKRQSEADERRSREDSDILFIVNSDPDVEDAHHHHGSSHARNAHGGNAHTRNAHAHDHDAHDEPPHDGRHYYVL